MWPVPGAAYGYVGRAGLTGVAVCGVPVRDARGAHVSHRGPGVVGRRRPAAISRARRRAGQDPRVSHRARRSPGSIGRAGRGGAGGGDRPRGPPRRQAPGGLCHRDRRPGRRARRAGRAAAGVHGAGCGGGDGCAAADGQRQTRHPRPAGAGVSGCRSVSRRRPTRSRRSWPASTPRCWAWSGSGSTSRSSSWAGTASCRCRWWRGRVPPAWCVGRATFSSSRPWPGWPGWSKVRWVWPMRVSGRWWPPRSCAGCAAWRVRSSSSTRRWWRRLPRG